MTFILGLLFAAKFVVPGLILRSLLRSLIKSFCKFKGLRKMRGTAVVIMMVIIVVGRVGQYILSLLFSTVHLDGIYSILYSLKILLLLLFLLLSLRSLFL